jgi:hypothetical protein
LSLADERRSRRFWGRGLDPLVFRVFLALVGTMTFVAAGLGIGREPGGLEWWGWLLVGLLASLGAFLIYASLFGSHEAVEKWSNAASSHEAAVALVLIAFPIAWAIRKVFHRDAT